MLVAPVGCLAGVDAVGLLLLLLTKLLLLVVLLAGLDIDVAPIFDSVFLSDGCGLRLGIVLTELDLLGKPSPTLGLMAEYCCEEGLRAGGMALELDDWWV